MISTCCVVILASVPVPGIESDHPLATSQEKKTAFLRFAKVAGIKCITTVKLKIKKKNALMK